MRLSAVELAEFRGWTSAQRVEFDPVVTIVHGPNGTGKTSLFDAVLWALTGSLRRLPEGHENDVVSRYGDTGLARVRAEFVDDGDSRVVVTRTTDGTKSSLSFENASGVIRGAAAESALIHAFWPSAGGSDTDPSSWARALTRSVYLQQDDVRRFVEADSDSDRFDAVAELLGVGRVTELQHQLERQRLQWTRGSNERREKLALERSRLAQGEARLASISSTGPGEPIDWASFRSGVLAYLPEVALAERPDAAQVAQQLDYVVRALETRALGEARRVDAARAAGGRLAVLESLSDVDQAAIEGARRELEASDRAVVEAQEELRAAQSRAAAMRSQLLAEHNSVQGLQTLAALALRHLGETCPVCDQPYDHAATRDRLSFMAEAQTPEVAAAVPPMDGESAMSVLAEVEAKRVAQGTVLRELERQLAERAAVERELTQLIVGLGLGMDSTNLREDLAEAASRAETDLAEIQRTAALAQQAALHALRMSEGALARDLKRSVESSRESVQRELAAIERRERAGVLASSVIEALRAAADELVTRQVTAMAPLIDRIYGRIDPHPSFRSLSLIARTWRGRGRLTTRISDEDNAIESDSPAALLSSSQMNAVALSVFLSLNLGIGDPPLDVILLDDPLQSLDEINLLGVVDLLRRSKGARQVVISTHDRRFATLLQRKLRPTGAGESVSVIRLDDWSRSGPRIQSARLDRVGDPWRIAETAS